MGDRGEAPRLAMRKREEVRKDSLKEGTQRFCHS
jgi:hypothetical protein